jgi:class 3 adenylate cyclase/tetratricopeptide (TPR) repeat protein
VTCLFIDIVGSTDLTIALGPERMQRLLTGAFAELSAIVEERGGVVEKFIGDAMFALFGAPIAHADDPWRALRAAEACAERIRSRPRDAEIALRVGVETGEALVDLEATSRERQRMAVGACVNVAARLQQGAHSGEILVGPVCHDAMAASAEFEPAGPLALKGIGEVVAWRLVRTTGAPSTALPFVGRDAELERLRTAFERTRAGAAGRGLIIGPPGQGKTRLVEEFLRRLGPTVRVLQARCRPSAEPTARPPLHQLLASDLAEVTGDAELDPGAVASRLRALLPEAEDATHVASVLCHSAGLSVDQKLLAHVPRDVQEEFVAGWRRYLASLARERPVLLHLEDVHWADPSFLRLVDRVTFGERIPLFTLATARPEFAESAHLRPGDGLVIELEPLDAPSALALARSAGAPDARAVARAEGNPLFIIELARAPRAAGRDLPITIHGAIAARLDELPPPERELLQRAAVVGEAFAIRDAALLAEREPMEVAGSLGRLAHLRFVQPVRQGYRFHHALVHDIAYSRLPVAERMRLHARYAQEGVHQDEAEVLAQHWWEALRPPDADWVWEDAGQRSAMRAEAIEAHLAAAGRLIDRLAHEEALGVLDRAGKLAAGARDLGRVEAMIGLVHARNAQGEQAWEHRLRALECYDRGGLTPPAGLYADLLEIPAFNFGYFRRLPDDQEVLRLMAEGERVARESGDEVALARLLTQRAVFSRDAGASAEALAIVERAADPTPHAEAFHRLALAQFIAGDLGQARSLFERVFDRLLAAGARINEPEALTYRALLLFHLGDLATAEAVTDRLLQISEQQSPHTQAHALAAQALVQLGRGEWPGLSQTGLRVADLVARHPEASWCLLGAAVVAQGAVADVLAGRGLSEQAVQLVSRMVPQSVSVQASSLMVPRILAGAPWSEEDARAAYAPKARLWDRQEVWDPCRIQLALACALLRRRDELERMLPQFDELAANGAPFLGAFAAALREEIAAAGGGPAPTHRGLRELGYRGLSELLSCRPPRVAPAS